VHVRVETPWPARVEDATGISALVHICSALLGQLPCLVAEQDVIWHHAGVAPNVLTYTTLMSACSRHGQWERALQAFHHMEAAGLQPDVLAYNSAITAYARAGAWEKACQFLLMFGSRNVEILVSSANVACCWSWHH
jgi:pentatricopeptide repeat protein